MVLLAILKVMLWLCKCLQDLTLHLHLVTDLTVHMECVPRLRHGHEYNVQSLLWAYYNQRYLHILLVCLLRIERWWFVISCWDCYICSILRNNFNQAIWFVMERTIILMFCRLSYSFLWSKQWNELKVCFCVEYFCLWNLQNHQLEGVFWSLHCPQKACFKSSLYCFTLYPIFYLVFVSLFILCSLDYSSLLLPFELFGYFFIFHPHVPLFSVTFSSLLFWTLHYQFQFHNS